MTDKKPERPEDPTYRLSLEVQSMLYIGDTIMYLAERIDLLATDRNANTDVANPPKGATGEGE
jgi:hypothetical protein